MAYSFTTLLDRLPQVGEITPIYSRILNNTSYAITVPTSLEVPRVLYGNAEIIPNPINTYPPYSFIAFDNNPIAIQCVTTISGNILSYILYTKAINGQKIPDNFQRFIQKIPKGVFSRFDPLDPQTAWVKAKSGLIDDFYEIYFSVQRQVFSSEYSQEIEFKYNGTEGLLSTSYDPVGLFHLFSSLATYGLNAFDLELLVSKYISFRIGIECPVYIVNDPAPLEDYWILGVDGYTQLDQTPPQTILAPDNYNPYLENIQWTIYQSLPFIFTDDFKKEITNFIERVSRADIGNLVTFSEAEPYQDGFTFIGPTYKGDPRIIYGKCILYVASNGQYPFPLNVLAYIKNPIIAIQSKNKKSKKGKK